MAGIITSLLILNPSSSVTLLTVMLVSAAPTSAPTVKEPCAPVNGSTTCITMPLFIPPCPGANIGMLVMVSPAVSTPLVTPPLHGFMVLKFISCPCANSWLCTTVAGLNSGCIMMSSPLCTMVVLSTATRCQYPFHLSARAVNEPPIKA